jgi:hypothetical protein
MRIKAGDTVQAIQWDIHFFGESFQLIGGQVAELALNFPELTENHGEEILTGGEYAFAPRKTTTSLERCCVYGYNHERRAKSSLQLFLCNAPRTIQPEFS